MKLKYLILGREKVNYSICIMNYKFSRGKLARDGLKIEDSYLRRFCVLIKLPIIH